MTIKDLSSKPRTSRYPSKRVSERSQPPQYQPEKIERISITFREETDINKRVMHLLMPRRLATRFHWWMNSRPRSQSMCKA